MTRDLHSAILFCAFLSSKSASNTAAACANARPIFSTLFQTSKETKKSRIGRLFRPYELKNGHVKPLQTSFFDKSYIPQGYTMKYALKSLKRAANSTANSPTFLHLKAKNMRRDVRYHRTERRNTSSSRYMTQPMLESLLRKRTMSTKALAPSQTSPTLSLHSEDSAQTVKPLLKPFPFKYSQVIKNLRLERLAAIIDITDHLQVIYAALSFPSEIQRLEPTLQIRLCLSLLLSAFQLSSGSNIAFLNLTDTIELPDHNSQTLGSYAWTLAQARAVWAMIDHSAIESEKDLALYHVANAQLLAFEGHPIDAEKEVGAHVDQSDALGAGSSWLVLQTHRVIFLSSLFQKRPLEETLLTCLRKPHLWNFLTGTSGMNTLFLTRKYGSLLRKQLFDILDQLSDPHSWYMGIIPKSPSEREQNEDSFGKEEHRKLGILLVHYLVNRMNALRSLDSYSTAHCQLAPTLVRMLDALESSQYSISDELKTRSGVALSRFGFLEDAEGLIKSTSNSAYQGSAILTLAAKQGDILRALDSVSMLQSTGSLHKRDIRRLLLAYVYAPTYELGPVKINQKVNEEDARNDTDSENIAIQDRILDAEEIFTKLLAPHGPSAVDYCIILDAYARRGDVDKVNTWIERMLDDGFPPEDIPWESALRAFAFAGNVESVVRMLDHLQEISYRQHKTERSEQEHRWSNVMNTNVFNILLELMAKRRDPLSANRLWRNVVFTGLVKPNFNSAYRLMRAHAEAGHWTGVIKSWRYLEALEAKQASESQEFRMPHRTTAAYNTVLRAYVAQGTPFSTMMNLFNGMRSLGVVPDSFTYTMMIISATDCGEMLTAMAFFREMGAKEAERGLSSTSTGTMQYRPIYALTYLLWGYLRTKQWPRAQEIYRLIEQRGLQLLPLTYAVLVKSYTTPEARGYDDEGLKVAEGFLNSLKGGWGDPSRSKEPSNIKKTKAVYDVAAYSPLMVDFVRQKKPEEVERTFEQMVAIGGDVSITGLTMLMDVYRRVGDVNGVRETWKTVLQVAMDSLEQDHLASQISTMGLNTDEDFEEGSDLQEMGQYNYLQSSRALLCYPFSIFMDAVSAVGSHEEVALEWKRLKDAGFSFDSHNWNHLVTILVRAGDVERAFEVVEGVIIPFALSSKQLSSGRLMPWEAKPSGEESDDEDVHHNQPLVDEENMRWGRRKVTMKLEDNPTRRAALELLAQEQVVSAGRAVHKDFVHNLWLMQHVSRNWYQWKPHKAVLKTLYKVLLHLESGRLVLPLLPPGMERDAMDQQVGSGERARALLETLRSKYPRTCKLAYDQVPAR